MQRTSTASSGDDTSVMTPCALSQSSAVQREPERLEFADRVAVVTGAASGIGQAVVRALAQSGARVAALDILPMEKGRREAGVTNCECDVTDVAQVRAAFAAIDKGLGSVELLVNAAGLMLPDFASEVQDVDWHRLFAVNARGVMYVCREAAVRMKRTGIGAIVTVASNAARVPRLNFAAYCASKAAALSYTKCLGLELAAYGIRCNVVSPGSTNTPMQASLCPSLEAQAAVIGGQAAEYRLGIPLGRIAEPEQVAASVLFCLSTRASHITMQEFVVDGGATLGA